MSKIAMLQSYLRYYFKAKNYRKVQSPFVAEFAKEVLEDRRDFYAFDEVEALRRLLLRDRNTIQVTDFGAGSQVHKSNERQIKKMAKHSITSPTFCRFLFRIINLYKPQQILELGTSLGVATLYQSFAALNSQITTIEGCPNIAARAQQHFDLLGVDNINSVVGQFAKVLPNTLKKMKKVDFAFLDGNHQKEATLDYFEQCLAYAHEGSVFVFDDIHWSEGMEDAWETIKAHPKVKVSIDLFFFGIIFFKKEQQRKHFTLIPSRWKPL
ncbi:MAG: class I SAM-dependent methyltransferase [Bacteroidota bacterium]